LPAIPDLDRRHRSFNAQVPPRHFTMMDKIIGYQR
jgi:hypothetical protein